MSNNTNNIPQDKMEVRRLAVHYGMHPVKATEFVESISSLLSPAAQPTGDARKAWDFQEFVENEGYMIDHLDPKTEQALFEKFKASQPANEPAIEPTGDIKAWIGREAESIRSRVREAIITTTGTPNASFLDGVRTGSIHGANAMYEKLQPKIAELESWKKQAVAVMPDFQAIGNAIGVKLGESVHDKILPAIEGYKAENKRLVEFIQVKLRDISCEFFKASGISSEETANKMADEYVETICKKNNIQQNAQVSVATGDAKSNDAG